MSSSSSSSSSFSLLTNRTNDNDNSRVTKGHDDGIPRLQIRCREGDLLLINTRLWWHATEIPSTESALDQVTFPVPHSFNSVQALLYCSFFIAHCSRYLSVMRETFLHHLGKELASPRRMILPCTNQLLGTPCHLSAWTTVIKRRRY